MASHPEAGDGHQHHPPIPEVEYVRTFAHVAQVQLRSVLDALTEQVDKLGELPRLENGGAPHMPPYAPNQPSDRPYAGPPPPHLEVPWQLEARPRRPQAG
jgi:hypothetical protein